MRPQGQPRRTFHALVIALAAAACEHGVDATGTVTVPLHVQRLFSASSPGAVQLEVQLPSLGTLRGWVAVLCDPGALDRSVPGKLFTLGCAPTDTATVSAWAALVPAGQPVDCTAGAPLPAGEGPPRAEALASDERTVPVNRYGGLLGCSDGDVPFTLTLKGNTP
jgi:hypothetical protein